MDAIQYGKIGENAEKLKKKIYQQIPLGLADHRTIYDDVKLLIMKITVCFR